MVSSGAEEGGINVSLLPLTKETHSFVVISNIKNIQNRTETGVGHGLKRWLTMSWTLKVWKKTSNHWQFQVVGNSFLCGRECVASYECRL